MSWLPSRAPSLSTCTIHVPFTCHRGEKILRRCHRSARLTYGKGFPPASPRTTHLRTTYLIISIFLHDPCTLMLDVSRVGKRMNKAHVKNRVEEHRFPMTEKEQGTSWWSVCTHNILYYSAI